MARNASCQGQARFTTINNARARARIRDSVGLGPAFVGLSANAGVNVENPGGVSPYYGAVLQYGLDWGWSLRAGAAVGGEMTFY